jgi:signal transduction histidine kinase
MRRIARLRPAGWRQAPHGWEHEQAMAKRPRESSRRQGISAAPALPGKHARGEGAEPPDDRDETIAELREAVRARDDFLAIAGHELRNPLTPIQLCVQLIRMAEEAGDFAKIRAELARLERLLDRFLERTAVLLDVSQITTGKLRMTPRELNVSELARGVVENLAPMLARSGSELTAEIRPDVIGMLDEVGVTQILDNLLSNAIKYGEGKPIELTLAEADNAARITVRDYGVGIGAEERERIFERFERAVRKSGQPGFGLGLWVARKLADAMGGSITVIGEKGAGSLFTVTLPLNGRKIDE